MDNVLNINPGGRDPRAGGPDAVERSGQAIIALLQQAADASRRNEDRAHARAEQLAEEVRDLENRMQQLEAHARHYQERATQAEKWLLRIYTEIQQRLIEPMGEPEQQDTRRQADR
ncbi:hypothetical protein [Variibacter gotjawalensis]|uniref:hypothetical protein n=1 Tax=Variibacter gotjawalensis TaxID=1333996 RepID=UPI000BBA98E1|nr:hypothetical protein [Variibacter gotjawalensis]NIK45724.1 hypothetical protein [Variibacter gotjawalensis]RZS47648.1 hypothetical protein EV661_0040 [Variibacter gotjawalensis]